MNGRLGYWLSLGLSGLALGLAAALAWVAPGNAELQKTLAERQAAIQQSQQIARPLYEEITAGLARFAAAGDAQIAEALAGQGVTLSRPAPPTPPAEPAKNKPAPAR